MFIYVLIYLFVYLFICLFIQIFIHVFNNLWILLRMVVFMSIMALDNTCELKPSKSLNWKISVVLFSIHLIYWRKTGWNRSLSSAQELESSRPVDATELTINSTDLYECKIIHISCMYIYIYVLYVYYIYVYYIYMYIYIYYKYMIIYMKTPNWGFHPTYRWVNWWSKHTWLPLRCAF